MGTRTMVGDNHPWSWASTHLRCPPFRSPWLPTCGRNPPASGPGAAVLVGELENVDAACGRCIQSEHTHHRHVATTTLRTGRGTEHRAVVGPWRGGACAPPPCAANAGVTTVRRPPVRRRRRLRSATAGHASHDARAKRRRPGRGLVGTIGGTATSSTGVR